MLYLVRLENLMYIYSANARKEGKLNVQSDDLIISYGTGRFAHETLRPRTFRSKHAKCSSLDVSSHNS